MNFAVPDNTPNAGGITNSAQASAQAMGAAGAGLASVGGAMESTSNKLSNFAIKMQRVENFKQESDYKRQAREEFARFQTEVMADKRIKPKQWANKWNDRYEKFQGKQLTNGTFSPESRDKLHSWNNDFFGNASIDVSRKAHLQMIGDAKVAYLNDREESRRNGDYSSSRDSAYNAHYNGLLSENELKKELLDIDKEELDNEMSYMRENDPFEHKKLLEENYYGLNKYENQKEMKRVESAIRGERADIGASMVDDIYSGEIKSLEDIEKRGVNLRPKTRHDLNNMLSQLQDDRFQKSLKTPEMQNQIAGEVSSLLNAYDPNGEDFDREYATIKGKISQIGEGPLRKEYENQLDAMREGKVKEIKSLTDLALKQIDEASDAGLYGRVGEPSKVKATAFQLLNDGFLDDVDKLQSLGFSEGDAKKIAKEDNLEDQAKLFEEEWDNEVNIFSGDEQVDKLASHIASGGSLQKAIHEYDDPASLVKTAQDEVSLHRKVGRIKNEFMQWRSMNKEATASEVEAKLQQIGVDISAGDTDMNTDWRKSATTSIPDTLGVGKGAYRVSNKTRDQITGFTSKPGARMISLDFNDADNKDARGIEIKVPSNATTEELESARAWARETQAFFKAHGVDIPIRHTDGIKRGGRGISGVFHTEPFFASNREARKAIEKDPKTYALILGRTLGNIDGANFIPPHEQGARGGAVSDGVSERDFALNTIIPHL